MRTGWFLGIEPTGRPMSSEFLDMYRAGADGRVNWHFLATSAWPAASVASHRVRVARLPSLPARAVST